MTSVEPSGYLTNILAEVPHDATAAGLHVEFDAACETNSTDSSSCSKCLRVAPQLHHAAASFKFCFSVSDVTRPGASFITSCSVITIPKCRSCLMEGQVQQQHPHRHLYSLIATEFRFLIKDLGS
jgi:hypothetical protein